MLLPSMEKGSLDADTDDVVMTNLKSVLTRREYAHVTCVEHVVIDELDPVDDSRKGRDYFYVIVTADRFYVCPRSFLTKSVRGKERRPAPAPIMFDDVSEMEEVILEKDVFDDTNIQLRSVTLDISYEHTPKASYKKVKTGGLFSRKTELVEVPAEPEQRKLRVMTFAKRPRCSFCACGVVTPL